MGECMSGKTVQQPQLKQSYSARNNIQQVDIVKVKLKSARDRISNFINLKNRDLMIIDNKINEKIPQFKRTGDKKQMLPLLKAKKDINDYIANAEVRLRLVNDKLAEVELQKINADTINALEDSNKYIKQLQNELQRRDWQNVLQEAKNKYQLQWPDQQQNLQNDPKFQAMWKQLGGDKIIQKRQTNVIIPNRNNQIHTSNMLIS